MKRQAFRARSRATQPFGNDLSPAGAFIREAVTHGLLSAYVRLTTSLNRWRDKSHVEISFKYLYTVLS